jgi:trans-aconitate 2-methyltransferase
VTTGWDPAAYLGFADERTRPFADLLARVPTRPRTITDLGCGPGHLSGLLRSRWPDAVIEGIDSSAEMVSRAIAGNSDPRISYRRGDIRQWDPDTPVDLLVSNAALQWLTGHLHLLPGLAGRIAPGGCLAFSVPGNFDAPSHRLLRELAGRPPYVAHTATVEHPSAHDAATYLHELMGHGWSVDAWETTYAHVLRGPDPVLRWISGTGARPVLQALPAHLRVRFEREYGAALRAAYPGREYGTVLPFRRVFCVAWRGASEQ